jgi:hypothetical protein
MQRPFPNGHKRPFGCGGYVTAVAVGQSQPLYSGVGIFNFNWYYLCSPPQIPRGPAVHLERRRLISRVVPYRYFIRIILIFLHLQLRYVQSCPSFSALKLKKYLGILFLKYLDLELFEVLTLTANG